MPDPESVWVFESISRNHHREAFDCGNADLDEYLRRYARQNEALGLGRTIVAVSRDDARGRVMGYFTLRGGSVPLDQIPEEAQRRLPKHPVPVVHLARLAVDREVRGRGLGALLLIEALRRAHAASGLIGARLIELHAIDDTAKGFYRHFGFQEMRDDKRHLYLPMDTIARLIER